MRHTLLFPAIIIASAIALFGCRAPECQQMQECCSHIEELDGLGGACADLASNTRDPMTCRDVVRTIGYMLDDRDEIVPEACTQ